MTVDPVELERLSKAVEQSGPMTASALVDLLGGERRETQRLVQAAIDRGVLTVGAGLKIECRTGQLVPAQPSVCAGCEGKPVPENNPCAVCGLSIAQPSGDVVEAVARAICKADWDADRLDEWETAEQAFYFARATAAITAYEAVSGVAKMRDAGQFLLDRLADHENSMTSDEDAREWHGHVTPALARFRAALGDKP